MKIVFLAVGGHKEPWLNEIVDRYEKKIGAICKCEVIRIKPVKIERDSREAKQKAECEALIKQIQKDDCVVLCDEAGEELDSKTFSLKLVRLLASGKPRVVFVVGGAYGFSSELRGRATWIWSFSKLTFNHHLAQAVLLEQVYRGLSIWKNLPYHNS